MRFGHYLEENLTPEWRDAYVDYKGCKKRIKTIGARVQNRGSPETSARTIEEGGGGSGNDSSDNDGDHGPAAPPKKQSHGSKVGAARAVPSSPRNESTARKSPIQQLRQPSNLSPRSSHLTAASPPHLDIGEAGLPYDNGEMSASRPNHNTGASASNSHKRGLNGRLGGSDKSKDSAATSSETLTGAEEGDASEPDGWRLSAGSSTSPLNPGNEADKSSRAPTSPRSALKAYGRRTSAAASPGAASLRGGARSIKSITSPRIPAKSAPSFAELYATLEPDEKAFFDFLESELQKVEKFYLARQKDAAKRGNDIQQQLDELAKHRKLYHASYPGPVPKWETKVERFLPAAGSAAAHATVAGIASAAQRLHRHSRDGGGRNEGAGGEEGEKAAARQLDFTERDKEQYTADRYTKSKQGLRKATVEHYRNLEIIKNYRIVNLTAFRKALKKFEKTTNIHCLEMFTQERISGETFAKGEDVEEMLKSVEELFTKRFEHGNIKKARSRLRERDMGYTHYASLFRSGVMIGVGLPLAIICVVEAIRRQYDEVSDYWAGLLQVYGGLYLPVIFALLFQINLDVFVSARINYEFVMELSRPTIDFRSYLEIPAFLFFTLSVCMYFSFFQIGAETVAPTSWPACWLVFVIVFVINPLPICRRRTRFWVLSILWKVFTPGFRRVDFIIFFIADELNSLAQSFSSILFMSCAYANRWPTNVYTVCPSGRQWPYILMLSIPATIRAIQCCRRYYDSRIKIHLVNAVKYLLAVAQYAMFVWWRSRGSTIPDNVFVGWITIAMVTAICQTSWDIIVDWSLFRPGTYGLRKDLGYENRSVYYLAMMTNTLIRFITVWYIPDRASHTRLRSWIFAFFEMLRRFQWNFFRVETEHLGNADAYRVTRDIPLPYSRGRQNHDSDHDDHDSDGAGEGDGDQNQPTKPNLVAKEWEKVKRRFLFPRMEDLLGTGRGPDELNVGPRGMRATREYEARRPGDYELDDNEMREQGGWGVLRRRILQNKDLQREGAAEGFQI